MRYTTLGFGDCTPDDDSEEPSRCLHCSNYFIEQSGIDEHCNANCWHLDNLGAVKKQVMSWVAQGFSEEKIIETMTNCDWFCEMTDPTVARWKRAIAVYFYAQKSRQELLQAA